MNKDPHTGHFAKGNSGRAKGTKNLRTLQWEELGKEITEANGARFNALLERLWNSRKLSDQIRAAELFLKVAEFFKPKLQRIYAPDPNPQTVPVINIVVQPPPVDPDGPLRSGNALDSART
ncbi:MAG: hypothetical protein IPJ76_04795 [Flavobacteriales bacterium]|nr:MAG: hypothetical protein IPJ76_04795 [Flavobacteriales bacterium]